MAGERCAAAKPSRTSSHPWSSWNGRSKTTSNVGPRSSSVCASAGKSLEGFDFSFNPGINRRQILDLAACQWIEREETILIVGPSGTARRHLFQEIGLEACRHDYHVLLSPLTKTLAHLHGGRTDAADERRLATYLRPVLLILDDFRLRPLRGQESEDFYEIISERYERSATIVTSNRDHAEWPEAFGENPLLASAALDRLAHRARLITITGAS